MVTTIETSWQDESWRPLRPSYRDCWDTSCCDGRDFLQFTKSDMQYKRVNTCGSPVAYLSTRLTAEDLHFAVPFAVSTFGFLVEELGGPRSLHLRK